MNKAGKIAVLVLVIGVVGAVALVRLWNKDMPEPPPVDDVNTPPAETIKPPPQTPAATPAVPTVSLPASPVPQKGPDAAVSNTAPRTAVLTPPPPPPPPVGTPTAPASPIALAFVEKMKDTKVAVENRQAEITRIAATKTPEAFESLTAVANARIYLNWAAVESLGSFRGTQSELAAKQYLYPRINDEDSQIACAAIRGYATLAGTEAIPALAQALQTNRTRPDGHQEIVCSAIVKAMQETGSTDTVPALRAELERSNEKGWSLEYGSKLVAALRFNVNDEARAAMTAYADRLQATIPEDKLAKKYYEDKIAEARAAAKR